MSIYSFIWILLPLAYFFIMLKVVLSNLTGKSGKEKLKPYIKNFLILVILLVLSVLVDNLLKEEWIGFLDDNLGNSDIFRFLIYPAMLLVYSMIFSSRD